MTATRSITRSPLIWVAGLVAIAFVVAVLASGGGDDETSTATETAAVTIDGDGLPPFTSTDDAAIGQAVPAFSGVSFDDSAVAVEPGARVYGFFAHWCPHCQRELPIVEEWLDEGLLPDGVDFVAVSTGVESSADNYPPSAWFTNVGYDSTVIVDDGDSSLAIAFGLTGYPYWVVTDAAGDVVIRVGGGVDRTGFQTLGELALQG